MGAATAAAAWMLVFPLWLVTAGTARTGTAVRGHRQGLGELQKEYGTEGYVVGERVRWWGYCTSDMRETIE